MIYLETAVVCFLVLWLKAMKHWTGGGLFHNIAHRGASAYAPDNSLKAIGLAAQHGATDVEVDLHCTADGQFVIGHDSVLGQPERFISELTLADYQRLCSETDRPVLLLEQVLEALGPNDLGLYLDVKQVLPGYLPALLEQITAAGQLGRVVIASLLTDLVKEAKRLEPQVSTSVFFYNPHLDFNSLVQNVGCDFLHPCFDIFPDPFARFTDDLITRIRRSGAGLIAWNIKDPAQAARIVSMDIDGVCADDPQIIKDALAQAGP